MFLCLLENQAILTKDNMIKRKWKGEPECYFCSHPETQTHLMFECSGMRVVWSVVALCFNFNTRPRSLEQFWAWIKGALPGGEAIYTLGLAAIC